MIHSPTSWILALLASSALLLSTSTIATGIETSKAAAKIRVEVAGPDTITPTVRSYINRELRSLGDVEIVENDPSFVISLVVIETTTVQGTKTGFVISSLIHQPFNNQSLSKMLQPRFKDLGMTMSADLTYVAEHKVLVGSLRDLQDLCKTLVTEFDANQLEQRRKTVLKLKEMMKDVEKKK